MKQTKLDNYFDIKFKKKTILINSKTPNNTPILCGKINNTSLNKLGSLYSLSQLSEELPKYVLRFDGASRGNPGKSGAGAVIYYDNKEIWSGSKYLGIQTNNYAEYYGMIIGLQEAIKIKIKILYVEGDSMLIINQMKGLYKVKSENLIELHKIAMGLLLSFNNIKFKHIYRNKNARADELANESYK
jgi:ribonuclease HI|tara:strand:- start:717 stop:1277 length:561 start_codon:yes stop_codon:yes gene_type:complete